MDQILKIFDVIMNFASAKSQTLSKHVIASVRQIIIFVVISIGAMALFCVGISIAVTDLAVQLDRPIIVGSALAGISLFVFFYCLSQKAWL